MRKGFSKRFPGSPVGQSGAVDSFSLIGRNQFKCACRACTTDWVCLIAPDPLAHSAPLRLRRIQSNRQAGPTQPQGGRDPTARVGAKRRPGFAAATNSGRGLKNRDSFRVRVRLVERRAAPNSLALSQIRPYGGIGAWRRFERNCTTRACAPLRPGL